MVSFCLASCMPWFDSVELKQGRNCCDMISSVQTELLWHDQQQAVATRGEAKEKCPPLQLLGRMEKDVVFRSIDKVFHKEWYISYYWVYQVGLCVVSPSSEKKPVVLKPFESVFVSELMLLLRQSWRSVFQVNFFILKHLLMTVWLCNYAMYPKPHRA